MGKSGFQPKNPRELQEIQVWLVARLGRVEKQLQVQEMMALHKGVLIFALDSSFRQFFRFLFSLFTLAPCQIFVSVWCLVV